MAISAPPVKLNLGSGPRPYHLKDHINVDTLPDADLVFDLTSAQWPWPDGSISHIRADNLLEHFDNDEFMFVMNEAHRVLEAYNNGFRETDRGTFWFRVPDAERWPDGAFGDPTHKRYFFPRSFYYFDIERPQWKNYGQFYGFNPWRVTVGRVRTSTVGLFFEATCKPVKS